MNQPASHVDDDTLSALVDRQLAPEETTQVRLHLETCSLCQQRLDDVRSVALLLRQLPEIEPPRDFSLGPRSLEDPPNVIRLRRWYTATRIAAASLAAVFVVMSVGTVYVDSRPAQPAAVQVAQPPAAPAANQGAQAPPAGAAAPVARTAASPAAASGAAAAPVPQSAKPQSDEQVAATTSVNALPTQVPTPPPTPRSLLAPSTAAAQPTDTAAPLHNGAAIVGLLAILALLAALIIRHRLLRTSASLS